MNRVLQEEFANLSWQYVDSSNLERVAFVPDFGRLWVQFLPKGRGSGDLYYYADVPQAVYEGLLAAPSKGKYLDRVLKKGGYGYVGPL
jgi:hypothetical protein